MSDRFEELIKASSAEMPDPGEYRRLNRSALRSRLRRMESPKRRHTLVLVMSCLAITVLFSGQLNKLGSDDFDLEIFEGTNALGGASGIYRDEFTGSTLVFRGTEEDARELLLQKAAQEGSLHSVSGLSYGGKTDWAFAYTHDINGKEEISNGIYNPPGYPRVELPNGIHFLQTYYEDLIEWTKSSPAIKEYEEEIEGTMVLMQVWKKAYPDFGLVTYTRGTPLPPGQEGFPTR